MNYDDDEAIPKQSTTTDNEPDLELNKNTHARIINKGEALLVECPFKVLLELKGVKPSAGRLGVDLVTILDIGNTMKGAKIAKMKLAMKFLLQKLSHTDRLSVVTFNGKAHRLCPLRQITENSIIEIANQVDGLVAESTKNMQGGLEMALKILGDRSNLKTKRRAAVMLMSDGIEEDDAESDASGVPVDKVPVYTFSFGSDCNTEVLNDIADKSAGGKFVVVPDLSNLCDLFSESLAALLKVVIKDLSLTVIPENGSKIFTDVIADNYQQTKAGSEGSPVTITFGALYEREIRKVLVKFTLPKVVNRCSANYLQIVYKYRVGDEVTSDERRINVKRKLESMEAENEEVLAEEKRTGTVSKIEAMLLDYVKKLKEAEEKQALLAADLAACGEQLKREKTDKEDLAKQVHNLAIKNISLRRKISKLEGREYESNQKAI